MEIDYKAVLGTVAVITAIISYVPYFRDIFAGKTKPHAFSWLVWGVLTAIAFAEQVHDKGGAGSWSVGLTAVALLVIFAVSLKKGEKDIRPLDWFFLAGSAVSLLLWAITSEPLLSIILITVINALGFLPTVRKSYHKPHQETLTTFVLSAVKYMLVVLALRQYTFVMILFPLSSVLINGLFVLMLLIRRHQVTAGQVAIARA